MSHKRLTVLIYGFIGLCIVSASIHYGFANLVQINEWVGLGFGFIFMLVSIFFHKFGTKFKLFYFLSFSSNMIGVGLSITAYYVIRNYALEPIDYLTAILISTGVIIGFNLLSLVNFFKNHLKLTLTLLIVVSFASSLALWLNVPSFTGLSFYYLNVSYFFMIGVLAISESMEDLSREMSFVSFGSYILVSIIVLIVITEGEALSGIGEGFGAIDPSVKKKRK